MAFLFVSALAVAGWALFIREEVIQVEVSGLEWERRVHWETRREYESEGWEDEARSAEHVLSVSGCQTRQRGTHPCNPHTCNCRPDISCNCTGGDTYECPPCFGGGTRECNCRRTDPYDCRCTRTVTSRRNGAARVRESCDTCYRGRTCDRCAVPRVCSTCRTPRVCQRCPRDRCDTCYDRCPTLAQWCHYRYDRWEPQPDLVRRGTGHTEAWPAFLPTGADQRLRYQESRWIRYREIGGNRGPWRIPVESAEFLRTETGQRFPAGLTRAGTLTIRRPP